MAASKKKKSGKRKARVAVAQRWVEITAVARYPRPAAWGNTDAKEIALMTPPAPGKRAPWHPGTIDFEAVARTPGRRVTEIWDVENLDALLGAICKYKQKSGIPTRDKNSIKRLNIISHANGGIGIVPLFSLSGEIEEDGTCRMNPSEQANPNDINDLSPLDGGIDESVMEWMNTSPKGIRYRDEARQRFTKDGQIGLIMCRVGVGALASKLMKDMANVFQVEVLGFDDEVWYAPTHENGVITKRNITAIGQNGTRGEGYFCAVKVPAARAGEHLRFNVKRSP